MSREGIDVFMGSVFLAWAVMMGIALVFERSINRKGRHKQQSKKRGLARTGAGRA